MAEKRLIDVNAVIKEHCDGCPANIQEACKVDPVCATMMWLVGVPTVDAVEVVRCKDCKWFNNAGCAIRIVDDSDEPKEMDFCSFGERKDNG